MSNIFETSKPKVVYEIDRGELEQLKKLENSNPRVNIEKIYSEGMLRQLEEENIRVESKIPYENFIGNKILFASSRPVNPDSIGEGTMRRLDNVRVEPQLNSRVWVEFHGSFSRVKVVAKGTDIFVHEGCFDECKCEEFRQPLNYTDYGKTWFKDLKQIRSMYNIEKVVDDYYEVKVE